MSTYIKCRGGSSCSEHSTEPSRLNNDNVYLDIEWKLLFTWISKTHLIETEIRQSINLFLFSYGKQLLFEWRRFSRGQSSWLAGLLVEPRDFHTVAAGLHLEPSMWLISCKWYNLLKNHIITIITITIITITIITITIIIMSVFVPLLFCAATNTWSRASQVYDAHH